MTKNKHETLTGKERDKWFIDGTVEYDPSDPFKGFTAEERKTIEKIKSETDGRWDMTESE